MRKVFISLLALAALASCTQSDLLEQTTDNEKVEVKLASTVTDIEAGTRTPVVGVSTLAAQVLLSNATGNYTGANLLHNGTMTFTNAAAASFATVQYYPADGSTVYLCGLYPSTAWTIGTAATTTATYSFDGKTDVMAAAEVSTVKTDGQDGGTPKQLAFNHLLTNIIVKAVTNTDGGVTAAKVQEVWGNITGITLCDVAGAPVVKNKVTVALKTGTAPTATAFATGTATNFYKASGATPTYTDVLFASTAIPTTSAAIAYSMVAPITINSAANKDEFMLKIITTEYPAGKEVLINLTKEAGVTTDDMQGHVCTVTLTFKATKIEATATVAAWKAGANSTVTVE